MAMLGPAKNPYRLAEPVQDECGEDEPTGNRKLNIVRKSDCGLVDKDQT